MRWLPIGFSASEVEEKVEVAAELLTQACVGTTQPGVGWRAGDAPADLRGGARLPG